LLVAVVELGALGELGALEFGALGEFVEICGPLGLNVELLLGVVYGGELLCGGRGGRTDQTPFVSVCVGGSAALRECILRGFHPCAIYCTAVVA
jgi:hypothetical protein